MKNIYLVFVFLGLATGVMSQSLTLSFDDQDISNDSLYLINGAGEIYLESHITIENVTDKAVDVQVKREEISIAENSSNSFCWGAYCYPPFISESSTPVSIGANDSNNSSFLGEYYPDLDDQNVPIAGTSVIRYTFFIDGNPDDKVSVMVFYQIGSASIQDWTIRRDLFKVYPNPTNGPLTIEFPGQVTQSISLRIFGITGQTYIIQDLFYGENHAQINLSDLPKGYYFVQIRNQDGSVAQKKILKTN